MDDWKSENNFAVRCCKHCLIQSDEIDPAQSNMTFITVSDDKTDSVGDHPTIPHLFQGNTAIEVSSRNGVDEGWLMNIGVKRRDQK